MTRTARWKGKFFLLNFLFVRYWDKSLFKIQLFALRLMMTFITTTASSMKTLSNSYSLKHFHTFTVLVDDKSPFSVHILSSSWIDESLIWCFTSWMWRWTWNVELKVGICWLLVFCTSSWSMMHALDFTFILLLIHQRWPQWMSGIHQWLPKFMRIWITLFTPAAAISAETFLYILFKQQDKISLHIN